MGFFDLKVNCSVCGEKTGLNRFQLKKDVWICPECLKEIGGTKEFNNVRQMKPDEIKKIIDTNKDRLSKFNPTKKIENYFYIDENVKQWGIPQTNILGKVTNVRIYKYDDIVDFELLEDGNSITKGGTGRALAGGILFGNTGAIVGGVTGNRKSKSTCSKLQIKITLHDLSNPVVYINFIETEFKKDGIVYKEAYNSAQKVLSLLQIICTSNNKENEENTDYSRAEEIKKFKELLDIGAITQEEYDKKKKELLN